MSSYKHMLIAIDLSEHCEQVIQRAGELAKCLKSTLDVVHTVDRSPLAYAGEFSIDISPDLELEFEQQAKKKLEELCKKHHIKARNIHVTSGQVAQDILDVAKQCKADCLVIGAFGHSGIRALLGSRANKIIQNSAIDVITIKNQG